MFNRLTSGIVSVMIILAVCWPSYAKNSFAILALSWQPAFCEFRQDRPECASQISTRYDASHFSLHGLWPGPRNRSYCGVTGSLVKLDKSGRWGKLPVLHLDPGLKSRLNQVMPGTRSFLQRHEWVKHGSCHENGSANGYYKDSLRLINTVNKSTVRQLFSDHLGIFLDTRNIRSAFDEAFGKGTGQRIRIKCKRDGGRLLISELTIGLYGEFDENTSLAQLILAANPTDPGCKGGIVDQSGLQ